MTDKLVKRLRERADATRRALLQERTNLYDEAADALERLRTLVAELDEHEGAEGWSEGMRERIDAAIKEQP